MKDKIISVVQCPDGTTLYTLSNQKGEIYTRDHMDEEIFLIKWDDPSREDEWVYSSDFELAPDECQ